MAKESLATSIPRVLLGLIFLTGSVDGFYYVFMHKELMHFPETAVAHQFTTALKDSGFFWPFMKTVQLIGGISLLFNLYARAGFLLLLPVITTIILFHFMINLPGAIFGMVLLVLSAWLGARYLKTYKTLIQAAPQV
jgi:putative oxidoreductase